MQRSAQSVGVARWASKRRPLEPGRLLTVQGVEEQGTSEMWMMSSYRGKLRSDNQIRPLPCTKRAELMNECIRVPGEVTNGHTDLRETGGGNHSID